MRILLVNPSNRRDQFAKLSDLATIAQPVGISSIANFLAKNNIEVKVLDAEANDLTIKETIDEIKNISYEIVGISAFTTKMTSATKIIKELKGTNIKTVIGGHHASAIPSQTLKETGVDYVVRGEGYTPLLRLCNYGELGPKFGIQGVCYRLSKYGVYISKRNVENFDDDYFPEYGYEFLPMHLYRAHHWQTWGINTKDRSGFAIVYSSLGCPFKCEYCTVNLVYGENRVRYKNTIKFVDEIEYLVNTYGTKYFEITDDTFTFNKKRVKEICKEMISRGLGKKIHAWCFGRVSTVDYDILSIMREAGIDWVFFGFESASESTLKSVNKNQTIDQMYLVRKDCDEIGINVGGNFIFGLPEDDHNSMTENLILAQNLNCEYVNFFLMMPYPGTKYYEEAKEKGYPLPKTWNDYGFFAPSAVPMQTKYLTPAEIVKFRDEAFISYFSGTSYQSMIRKKFGQETMDFINNEVLSKRIERK